MLSSGPSTAAERPRAGLRTLLAEAAANLRVAVSFLTVLPVGPREAPSALAPARAYFPLVGLLLGGGLAALDLGLRQVFPPLLTGAILLAALVAATRALHAEGFIDSCDALWGGHTRQRRLEILRDPRVGAFGVIGGLCLFGTAWAALVALPSPERRWVLLLYPCLSRWGMVIAMEAFPYARPQGLGLAFSVGRRLWQPSLALATALAAAALLAGWAGLLMLALATALAWALGRWMAGLLGGLTGDSYGAINEAVALAALLLAVALANRAEFLFHAPLPSGP